MNSLSSVLPSPLLLFISVYFTRSNICQHGSRGASSQGELFLYKTNNLSSAEAVLSKAAIWMATKCKMVSPCVGCTCCFNTQRNKYFRGRTAKLAIYRDIQGISIPWPSNRQSSTVHNWRGDGLRDQGRGRWRSGAVTAEGCGLLWEML